LSLFAVENPVVISILTNTTSLVRKFCFYVMYKLQSNQKILFMADILNPMPSGCYTKCHSTQAIIHHGHTSGSHYGIPVQLMLLFSWFYLYRKTFLLKQVLILHYS